MDFPVEAPVDAVQKIDAEQQTEAEQGEDDQQAAEGSEVIDNESSDDLSEDEIIEALIREENAIARQNYIFSEMTYEDLQAMLGEMRADNQNRMRSPQPLMTLGVTYVRNSMTDFAVCYRAVDEINPGMPVFSDFPALIFPSYVTGRECDLALMNPWLGLVRDEIACPGCFKSMQNGEIPHWCDSCGMPLCSQSCEENGSIHKLYCSTLNALKDSGEIPRREMEMDLILIDFALFRLIECMDSNIGFKSEVDLLSHSHRVYTYHQTPEFDELRKRINPRTFQWSYNYVNGDLYYLYLGLGLLNALSLALSHRPEIRMLVSGLTYFEHDCSPNTQIEWDKENRVTVRAIRRIEIGESITIDWLQESLLPTVLRRDLLLTRFGVDCLCARCMDPTECGSFCGSLRCQQCNDVEGFLVPRNPLHARGDKLTIYACTICDNELTYGTIKEFETFFIYDMNKVVKEGTNCCTNLHYMNAFKRFDKDGTHPHHYLCLEFCSYLCLIMNKEKEVRRHLLNTENGLMFNIMIYQRMIDFEEKVQASLCRALVHLHDRKLTSDIRLKECLRHLVNPKDLDIFPKRGRTTSLAALIAKTGYKEFVPMARVRRQEAKDKNEEPVAQTSETQVPKEEHDIIEDLLTIVAESLARSGMRSPFGRSKTPKASPSLEVVVAPEIVTTPEDATAPEIATAPEVVAEPETSVLPKASPSLEDVVASEVMAAPEMSVPPKVSPSLDFLAAPIVSAVPEVSPNPEVWLAPEDTTAPQVSVPPKASRSLHVLQPEDLAAPQKVVPPRSSRSLKVVASPQVSVPPQASQSLQVLSAPQAAVAPKASNVLSVPQVPVHPKASRSLHILAPKDLAAPQVAVPPRSSRSLHALSAPQASVPPKASNVLSVPQVPVPPKASRSLEVMAVPRESVPPKASRSLHVLSVPEVSVPPKATQLLKIVVAPQVSVPPKASRSLHVLSAPQVPVPLKSSQSLQVLSPPKVSAAPQVSVPPTASPTLDVSEAPKVSAAPEVLVSGGDQMVSAVEVSARRDILPPLVLSIPKRSTVMVYSNNSSPDDDPFVSEYWPPVSLPKAPPLLVLAPRPQAVPDVSASHPLSYRSIASRHLPDTKDVRPRFSGRLF